MNILYDGQVFSFQEHGGISRYYYQLLKIFSVMEGINTELIIKYSNNDYIASLGYTHVKHFFPYYRFKGRNEIIKILNRIYFRINFHKKSPPDVFHPTYYNPYFLDLIGDIPFVLTIHDMAHEIYPLLFSRFDFTSTNKKLLASKAHRIITVSEHTKKDVIAILGIPESKIDVIHHAATLSLTNIKQPSISLPHDFILYVGKRNTYKNFFFLLQALAIISKNNKTYTLICAGGGKFSRQETIEIYRLQLTDKIIQMNVDDDILAYLYSKAKAFVYPSLYEGFGIPILEAFACGCPAILSNRSSLPEVGGDAAQYFDPEDINSLMTQLTEVLSKKDLADDMRTKGFERVKLFSWEKTARKTLETYNKVIC